MGWRSKFVVLWTCSARRPSYRLVRVFLARFAGIAQLYAQRLINVEEVTTPTLSVGHTSLLKVAVHLVIAQTQVCPRRRGRSRPQCVGARDTCIGKDPLRRIGGHGAVLRPPRARVFNVQGDVHAHSTTAVAPRAESCAR